MRYLGIDYGEKRIGLAISDEGGRIAFPYGTVDSLAKIAAIINKEKISKIVVGLPLSFSRRESDEAMMVRKFAKLLREKVKLSIEFEDETLTTKIAARSSTKKKLIDASAAALILQSYLDKNKVQK